MIKLLRSAEPVALAQQKNMLLQDYRKSHKPVWNDVPGLRAELLQFSHHKCAYCERKLSLKTLTVEHFHPQDKAPNEALEWNNLLPSCSDCNHNKGNFDTVKQDFLDPCKDDPRHYLKLNPSSLCIESRIAGQDKAKNTIETLKFNKINGSLMKRRTAIFKEIKSLLEKLDKNYLQENAYRCLKDLLSYTDDSNEMSAVYASLILSSDYYQKISDKLKQAGRWDQTLQDLETKAQQKRL